MSLHTAVKGQFGLGTGRAMGKALKKMHFSKISRRKKRLLPLQNLRTTPESPPYQVMWRQPVHHVQGQEHLWFEATRLSHAAFCGCGDHVGHLTRLSETYGRGPAPRPPGAPQPPVNRGLPALPPPPEPALEPAPWRGGGGDEGDGRGDGGDGGPGGDAPYAADELEDLFAAVEEE